VNGFRGLMVDHIYENCPALKRAVAGNPKRPVNDRFYGRPVFGIEIDAEADGWVCGWCLRVARARNESAA
jgi:hypothetical protein